jgi:hypothetical protein
MYKEGLNNSSLVKTQSLSIFNKFIKNNSKLIPFKLKKHYTYETKYFPPFSKEWKDSIYVFNSNNLKNFSLYNININTLVKYYFNLYFNHKFLNKKFISPKRNRSSLNKIFISKAEIKHTNSKARVTIYTYNREKLVLLKKIKKIKKFIYNNYYNLFKYKKVLDHNLLLILRIKTLSFLRKELILFRRFKLKLNLNKYKFEEKFLYKLSKLISTFYNKKVEFNIINLKSIILNSDFFTKILSLKLKNRNANIIKLIRIILNKMKFKENTIKEKSRITKTINMDLISNKYKNLNLEFIINSLENNYNYDKIENYKLDNILKNFSLNYIKNWQKKNLEFNNGKLSEIILNSIKYKNIGGIRLEIKGRLTKRYRADRALFKVKWKGGLKNIDSSYKGLSSVNFRGFIEPNVEYSIHTSKRRIGAFAVKGWISGK